MNTLTTKNITKKLIGTSLILGVPVIALLAVGTDTFAQFIDTGRNVVVDGVVIGSTEDEVTVATSGAEPIEFAVTDRTVVVGDDRVAAPGDGVKVIGRNTDGVLSARVIQLSEQPSVGYGQAGDAVIARNGAVVEITDDSLTIETANTTTTYNITDDTRFLRASQSELESGDEVQVIGEDTSTGFAATMVVARN